MDIFNKINRFYYEMSRNELKRMNKNELYPNISYNSLLYLDLIAYMENCTVSSLAKELKISKSAVTIKVNELMKQGFLERIISDEDKRVKYLRVKPEIVEEYKAYDSMMKKATDKIEQRYDEKDIQIFCEMLDLISLEHLEDE